MRVQSVAAPFARAVVLLAVIVFITIALMEGAGMSVSEARHRAQRYLIEKRLEGMQERLKEFRARIEVERHVAAFIRGELP